MILLIKTVYVFAKKGHCGKGTTERKGRTQGEGMGRGTGKDAKNNRVIYNNLLHHKPILARTTATANGKQAVQRLEQVMNTQKMQAIHLRGCEYMDEFLVDALYNTEIALWLAVARRDGLDVNIQSREVEKAVMGILDEKNGMMHSALDAVCFSIAWNEANEGE